eukprot:CAMPEP_0196765192 /NCGR_PEP_ID=MMETSP1095-20130614/7775_1 /TAXON_ID=96789 ORGANISM="Chromulina nebulosa, Strain UTEXLB2642" /NCGR_SAMPLE_ID=MMETSP1095 /ASSEMBLY_ACC=CAM_ASM_000446 /LENGTH=72 /DNA_ID=CAMNT_0042122797 /DNA_START=76 /DNA_END=290 /DNA_ORIENTATION=-
MKLKNESISNHNNDNSTKTDDDEDEELFNVKDMNSDIIKQSDNEIIDEIMVNNHQSNSKKLKKLKKKLVKLT